MATPSGSTNPSKAAQNAATPQSHHHLGAFSSPAPRSVPSPATHRAQAGKSPFGASKHPTSSTVMADSNHPTGGSSASGAGKLLGSSPAAALLGTDSPAAMMFNLSNSGIDGGVPMAFSMSGLTAMALSKTSTTGRPDDEERRKRLIEIIRLLGTRYPRVSLEGIESLGKRYGLDTVVEPPDRFKEVGECVVAGRNGSFMVAVPYNEFKQITSTTFNFSDKASDAVRKHEATAQKAIMRTLSLDPGQSYITSSLEKFAKNLERLSRMDKLSGAGFSCFEAIAGVYSSLEKLYEHEEEIAMTLLDAKKGDIKIRANREVMCKKSGRPVMNPRKTVGLCLDYWMDERKVLNRHHPVAKSSSKGKEPEAMEIDYKDDGDGLDPGQIYTLVIECEDNPSVELYQSARISNAWISDPVEKQNEDPTDLFGPTIDWLEPPPTYSSAPGAAPTDGSLQHDSSHMGKLPHVRFVARLDPPLVLPQAEAANLLASVNSNLPETEIARTYAGLLFEVDATEDYNSAYMGLAKEMYSETLAVVPDGKVEDGKFLDRQHTNTLFINRPELGRVLEEIPFAHPKQLVQMLPTLRQYAYFNQMLRDKFKARTSPHEQKTDISGLNTLEVRKMDIELLSAMPPRFTVVFGDQSKHNLQHGFAPPMPESLTLNDMLNQPAPGEDSEMTDANKPESPGTLTIQVEILLNAEIQINEHNLLRPKPGTTVTLDTNAEHNPQEQEYNKVAGWLAKSLDNMSGELGCWSEAMAMKAKLLADRS